MDLLKLSFTALTMAAEEKGRVLSNHKRIVAFVETSGGYWANPTLRGVSQLDKRSCDLVHTATELFC